MPDTRPSACCRLLAAEDRCEAAIRVAARWGLQLVLVVLAVGAVKLLAGGRVRVETPPDPRTGRTYVEMDRLDLVHALCQQIPDAGLHMVRYYGT